MASVVVDWIDVEFELGRPSQHWHLNDRIEALTGRKEYPEALDVGPGGTATRYRLRVQEPDFGQLKGVLADIRSEYGFAAPALVVGIEVCIDAYPLRPSEEARARLHGVLVRHFFPTSPFLRSPSSGRGPFLAGGVAGRSTTSSRVGRAIRKVIHGPYDAGTRSIAVLRCNGVCRTKRRIHWPPGAFKTRSSTSRISRRERSRS